MATRKELQSCRLTVLRSFGQSGLLYNGKEDSVFICSCGKHLPVNTKKQHRILEFSLKIQ